MGNTSGTLSNADLTDTAVHLKHLQKQEQEKSAGNTEFDKDLVKKYKDEITKINEPKIAEMETIKKMYDALVVKYGQDKIVIDRLTQLFQELQTKNDALKNDVNNYYSITNTSVAALRVTVYDLRNVDR